ncbi:hypothetical protein APM_1234, partial [Acidiphilium sp. PM]
MRKDPASRHRPTPHRAWRGIRLKRVEIGIDPDAAPEPAIIPADWSDQAAAGLVALRADRSMIGVDQAADAWIAPLAAAAERLGRGED